MTFEDIAAQCRNVAKFGSGRLMLEPDFLDELTAPNSRGWFRACHAWLHSGPSPDAYKAEIRALLKTLDGCQRTMATLHLRCVKQIRTRDHWPSLEDALAALAKKCNLKKFGFA